MEKESHLLPLLTPSSTTTTTTAAAATTTPPADTLINTLNHISTNPTIVLRLCFVIFITLLSIWANHEASKGYTITVINESTHAFSRNRFQLFYVSNDEATRIILKASQTIEHYLYHDHHDTPTKKHISHLILKLSDHNLTHDIIVESTKMKLGEYVIHVSPSILLNSNFKHIMPLALQKGIVRVWLWDGRGNAPTNLINGLVEYLSHTLLCGRLPGVHVARQPASAKCWEHSDTTLVADFVKYWEIRRPGFVRALNQAMSAGWDDGIFVGVVGQPGQEFCREYNSSSV